MTFEEIKKYLLTKTAVQYREIKRLGLKRFTLHDVPFVVFQFNRKNELILNVRCRRDLLQKYHALNRDVVSKPFDYNEKKWIIVDYENAESDFLQKMLDDSYDMLFIDLSVISRMVYHKDVKEVFYKDLSEAEIQFKIDFNDRIKELDSLFTDKSNDKNDNLIESAKKLDNESKPSKKSTKTNKPQHNSPK